MSLTLAKIPGFNDLSDTPLTHDKPAFGIHLSAMSDNAAFGLVATEVFQGNYKNGDTVDLPVSTVDGYQYQRDELNYIWGVFATTNPDTGWITGPDSLWYMGYKVDQNTGEVFCLEWYRPWASSPAQSQDGQLIVWTIARRQKSTITLASTPSFSDLADGTFYQDAPYKESTARGLAHNSKYAAVKSEIIYMGEFYTGQTVPQPVSPVDGFTYNYADVKFTYSWRWTTDGASQGIKQPVWDEGQFAGMSAAINPTTGAVSLQVSYIRGGGEGTVTTHTSHGRIAVFACCSRTTHDSLVLGVGGEGTHFSEITQDHWYPGKVMQASVMSQMNKNCREAVCTPEFFPPATYYDGGTVPVPTSPIDGHVYSRAELFYVWEWADTYVGTLNNRVAMFYAKVNPSNGAVSVDIWRLPPGGPYRHQHGDDAHPGTHGAIKVTVIGVRTANNDTTNTKVTLPFPTLNAASSGDTGGSPEATHHAGTAVKINGAQYFPSNPLTAAVTISFKSSNSTSTLGLLRIYAAEIVRTLHGQTAVIDSQQLLFGGSSTVDVALSTSITCDPIVLTLDAAHDYYVLVSHYGAEAQLAFNDTSVTALHGKIESSPRFLYFGIAPIPTETDWLGASDMSIYFAVLSGTDYTIPANRDVWAVISGFSYDPTIVAPPVDSSGSNSDNDQSWLMDGS